ncbi:MAG: FAD-dependent oxidoreductase, partial [Planctomycetota bacterium]
MNDRRAWSDLESVNRVSCSALGHGSTGTNPSVPGPFGVEHLAAANCFPFDFMKQIVLLGIGHTNAEVVRRWARNPIDGCKLVCVSNESIATYSGMLPGVLAGRYPIRAMEIPLNNLCDRANAQLIVGHVTGLDTAQRLIHLQDQSPVQFDVLSIGIGSTSAATPEIAEGADGRACRVVPIKPMQSFRERFQSKLERCLQQGRGDSPTRLSIIGDGAAAVEVAMCIRQWLRHQGDDHCRVQLVGAAPRVLPGRPEAVSRIAAKTLRSLSIDVHSLFRVQRIEGENLRSESGE